MTFTDNNSVHQTGIANAWLTCPQPNPNARLRLFCFPYAGSGAAIYYPWAKLLPSDIELYAIRLPGRESRIREAPYLRLKPLVEDLTHVLFPYLNKPFAFFGHSMGSLICFELALHLRRKYTIEPIQLFVSGRRAPQLPDPDPPLHQLPDKVLVEELQQRYGGIPQVILENEALMQMFLPVLRSDLTVIETYRYVEDAPFSCPINAFGGKQDSGATQEELAAWESQTFNAFNLRTFPGDHFFLQSEQKSLLHILTKELTQILSQPEGIQIGTSTYD